jgi:RNA polymerase sigma-70 factor, ECF subfamily
MPELRLIKSELPRATGSVLPMPRFASDEALVAGIRRGEPAAATALVERYRGLVERTLVRVLGFDSELADLVQEAFIRVLNSTRQLRDPQALPKWMIRIAACTAADHLRRRKRWRWLTLVADPPEDVERIDDACFELETDFEARRALKAAQAVLSSLPIDERLAFSLRRFDGMQLKDVAHACGCSLATVKRRLVRAERRFLERVVNYPELAKWLSQTRGGEA